MTDPRNDLPPLLDIEPHVTDLLGIARGTAYRLVQSKEIPSIKLGRLVKVPRDQLLRQLGLLEEVSAA